MVKPVGRRRNVQILKPTGPKIGAVEKVKMLKTGRRNGKMLKTDRAENDANGIMANLPSATKW